MFVCPVEDSFLLDGILDYWVVVSLLIVSAVVLLPLVALLYQLMGFHAMLGLCFYAISVYYSVSHGTHSHCALVLSYIISEARDHHLRLHCRGAEAPAGEEEAESRRHYAHSRQDRGAARAVRRDEGSRARSSLL